MKISIMKEIQCSRNNLTGFLHINDIKFINVQLNDLYDVNHASFNDLCEKTIELYQSKTITNKQASLIFEVLMLENTSFKIESYRYDSACHKIYRWNEISWSYLFLKFGTKKDFHQLKSLNPYFDES